MHLVQVIHADHGRAVALVDGPQLLGLHTYASVYALVLAAIEQDQSLSKTVNALLTGQAMDYEAVYAGRSPWRLLPPLDHPRDPARCLVAGTGLTHVASARNRQAMHAADGAATEAPVTDSMRIFQWGVDGGKPAPGTIGVQPEWFYKGRGEVLRAHGDPLPVPSFADDGGEEPEIVGLYVIAPDGTPCRVGICQGNEFSDHVMEKKNYLYLAPSKLRCCAIGPELRLGPVPASLAGRVSVARGGAELWGADIASGEANMSHSIENLEHHHFNYASHRRPGDVHVFFFGADAFSFGEGVELADGDRMHVAWNGLGRPLVNPLAVVHRADRLVTVRTL
jgi:hypothetical protein